ncbi:hypothetical protein [Silvanigrella aquatica]|uniref:Uncharacterized protein n=1 Tax=Silvanigrella aquatica TaxID=1915309 RepID=A0A1L4D024_9BACT|nr:hypothetical protein [Silvanigrella aquatica]APJ03549.1 hypothetical protein AXG55_06365 [Silvanigrella aquatica]
MIFIKKMISIVALAFPFYATANETDNLKKIRLIEETCKNVEYYKNEGIKIKNNIENNMDKLLSFSMSSEYLYLSEYDQKIYQNIYHNLETLYNYKRINDKFTEILHACEKKANGDINPIAFLKLNSELFSIVKSMQERNDKIFNKNYIFTGSGDDFYKVYIKRKNGIVIDKTGLIEINCNISTLYNSMNSSLAKLTEKIN